MKLSEKLVWQIYSGVLGAAATFVAQKLITKIWEASTGMEPPDPNDPETPVVQAIIWAASSGVGVGVTQIMMNRYVQKRWIRNMGNQAPSRLRNHLDLKK